MIVEGKHAEVGQGIFISDIQDNSNADRVSFVCIDREWSILRVFECHG